MARGGYRPGSGPPKGTKYRPRVKRKPGEAKQKPREVAEEIKEAAAALGVTPLEYMLKVMNDETEDKNLRARMAVSAAPYMHPRKGEGAGKKEDKQDRAAKAGSGKFKASATPLKLVGKI